MDRRLPIRPGTYRAQMARRELYLEQRLDQLGKFRPRSQRFLNPPCCADCPPWTVTTGNPGGAGPGYNGSYEFTVESVVTTFHAEGIYDDADPFDWVLTAAIYDDLLSELWSETFTFPAATDGDPWTFDATPDVTVPVGGLYVLSCDNGTSSEMTSVLTLESCGEDAVMSFASPG